VNSVVSVERHNERVLILKVVLDNGLLTVLTAYAPHSGKPEEEKENFWNKSFSLASCIIMAALCRVRPMYTSDIENRRHRSLLEHR